MLPEPARAVLLFDRGYARIAVITLLKELGVHYVMRIQKNVWVNHRAHTGCLRGYTVDTGVQPERVEKLLLGMPAPKRREGTELYHAATFPGAEVRKLGLRKKVLKDG